MSNSSYPRSDLVRSILVPFAIIIFTVSATASTFEVPAGGNLQSAINAAQPGDTIILQANVDYVCESPCVLRMKSGTDFITIASSRYAEIPVRDFFSKQPSPEVAQMMARVRSLYSTEPVFATAPGAHHYKLLGLNLAPPLGQATRIVQLGLSGTEQDTLAEMPHDFVIDKSWIHADIGQDIQRCLALNSSNTDITNSWFTECHGNGYDSQAIAGWNGGGNYRIINNALSGAGENVMFGGSPASIPSLIPTNIEFRQNFVWKPLSWYANDPSYAGRHWSVKNLFELKSARNVVVDGNVFEGNWTDAQAGRAIVFTPRPSDSGSWAAIEDVQFTNNIVRETGNGMLLLGADQAAAPTETRLHRVRVANNLFLVDGVKFASNGFFLTVIHKTEDVTIEHNTAIQTGNIIGADYDPNVRFIYRNNISRHNEYGIFGGGIGYPAIEYYFPNAIITGNVIAKEVNSPWNAESRYPAGNFFPESLAAAGFVDLAGGNYRLASFSPYKGLGTDGADPGVDMDRLMAAIGGAVPTPTPTPTATPTPTPTPSPSPTPTSTNHFQLSSPIFNVFEGGGSAHVTVGRTSSTGAASVDYRTSDTAGLVNCNHVNGVASARCDYTIAVGTLRFAPGESAKSISIPIVDDGYADGNENFSITLSNANGANLGSPSVATIIIQDKPSNGANPIDGTAFFVRQQYLDFLNREPDAGGYEAWQQMINNCEQGNPNCDRIHVSLAFFRSPEFQNRGYFVYRFYPVAFGRKPDYTEFSPDLARVSVFSSAAELDAAKLAFISDFMSRPEFVTKFNGLTDTQYVDTLLATAGITSPNRNFWIVALGNGTRTRASVLREISESTEVYNRYYNQAFVVMQYFGYLRRDPDASYLAWIDVLNSSGNFRGMVNGFLNSAEYRSRLGP